jgi:hypothetical protein
MKDIQALADEAFADILKKYHRPTGLKEALRQSAREQSENSGDEPDLKTFAFRQSAYLASPRSHPRMRDEERNPRLRANHVGEKDADLSALRLPASLRS